MKAKHLVAAALGLAAASAAFAAPPTVEMTWMSIANWYFKIGNKRIVMDGYITRVPESQFIASSVFPKDHVHLHQGPVRRRQRGDRQGARAPSSAATSSTCCSSAMPIGTTAGTRRRGRE